MPKATNESARQAKTQMADEASIAGREDLMEAMVAACAIIAFADGKVDWTERRRTFQMMRAIPAFAGFSSSAIADEFARHERAFQAEPERARERAFFAIAVLEPHATHSRMLLSACEQVLEADGIHHPLENQELGAIGKLLGAC